MNNKLKVLKHPLLGEIKLPWEYNISLLCTASYGGQDSKYHCDKKNSYYALDFDRPWEGNIEPETKILVISSGEVTSVNEEPQGLGLYVKVKHIHGIVSLYAHLKKVADDIYLGRKLGQGEIIGSLGETGKAYGPHLHFQLLVNGKCLKEITDAKPEPISGYSNLMKGQWYKSDNCLKRKR